MSSLKTLPREVRALTDARALVMDPQAAHCRPNARLLAWATLKSARGQTISQIGLSRLQDVQRKLQPSPTRRLQDILGGAA